MYTCKVHRNDICWTLQRLMFGHYLMNVEFKVHEKERWPNVHRTSTTYRICHPCSLYKCPHFHLAVIPFEHQPKSFRYPYFSCCVYVLSDPTHPEHSQVRLPAMYIVSEVVLRTGLSLGISSLGLLLLFWKI